jgi:nitrate reductase NapE component
MMRRRLLAIATLATVFAAREAHGDPIYHIKVPSVLKTEKGTELPLPPGWFLDEQSWQERDLEMRRLQEQETRLNAENESLRKSAVDDYPWLATGVVGAFGVVLGVFFMVNR